MASRSTVATLAVVLGGLGLAAVVVGIGGIQLGLLSPLAGFFLAGLLTAVCGLGAVIAGLVGLVRTRAASGRAGRERAWGGLGLGVLLVAGIVSAALSGSGGATAPIHDVTTNMDDPPEFSDAVRNAPGRQNGVDYPDGGETVPDQQRIAYPDLAPIELDVSPSQALERAQRVAEGLGWTVTAVDRERGIVEAFDVTRFFRFVDDVVIRVRPRGAGSVVDLRSNSRVGGGDLGANARRVRAFRDRLLERS